jgi:hypothetical protein
MLALSEILDRFSTDDFGAKNSIRFVRIVLDRTTSHKWFETRPSNPKVI